jgi:hypothetical protein
MVFYFQYTGSNRRSRLIFSAALLCLATLAKLPFILFGSVVTGTLIYQWKNTRQFIPSLGAIVIFTIILIPAFAWYIWVIPGWHGNGVTLGMLDGTTYNFSEILHILSGTLVSVLPEMLLNYGAVIFFIYGLFLLAKKDFKANQYSYPLMLVLLSFTAYFLFEMNMIALVHDYYMMPFLPVLFIIVAWGANKLLNNGFRSVRVLSIILLLSLPVLAATRINGRWDPEKPGFNKIYYRQRDELQKLVPKNALVVAGNDISHYILLYYLDRKGWAFDTDHLYDYELRYYISQGAEYLFSDSRADMQPGVQQLIESTIFEQDNLKVYKLKNKTEI